jgi:hypothetical protein
MFHILLHAVIVWVVVSILGSLFIGGMLSAFKAPRKEQE